MNAFFKYEAECQIKHTKYLDTKNEICEQETEHFNQAAIQSAVNWHERTPSAWAATD